MKNQHFLFLSFQMTVNKINPPIKATINVSLNIINLITKAKSNITETIKKPFGSPQDWNVPSSYMGTKNQQQ